MRAQSNRLWFQFDLAPGSLSGTPNYKVATDGYDERMSWLFMADNQMQSAAARIVVRSIDNNRVVLEVAAKNFGPGKFEGNVTKEVFKLPLRTFLYSPDQTLEIPVEGGGKLTLRGEVVDHKPRFAEGWPLEPKAGQLIVRSPVLQEGQQVLADLEGASALVDDASHRIALYVPAVGRFAIGFQQFPGSVRAEANWSYLKFEINGKHYLMTSDAPISGGDQPRTLWVGLDPTIRNDRPGLGTVTM